LYILPFDSFESSGDDYDNSYNDDLQQDTSSSGDDDGSDLQQVDTSSSEEESTGTVDDFDQTIPLLQQIREGVSIALSASRIVAP
jgi:hypothetical protein